MSGIYFSNSSNGNKIHPRDNRDSKSLNEDRKSIYDQSQTTSFINKPKHHISNEQLHTHISRASFKNSHILIPKSTMSPISIRLDLLDRYTNSNSTPNLISNKDNNINYSFDGHVNKSYEESTNRRSSKSSVRSYSSNKNPNSIYPINKTSKKSKIKSGKSHLHQVGTSDIFSSGTSKIDGHLSGGLDSLNLICDQDISYKSSSMISNKKPRKLSQLQSKKSKLSKFMEIPSSDDDNSKIYRVSDLVNNSCDDIDLAEHFNIRDISNGVVPIKTKKSIAEESSKKTDILFVIEGNKNGNTTNSVGGDKNCTLKLNQIKTSLQSNINPNTNINTNNNLHNNNGDISKSNNNNGNVAKSINNQMLCDRAMPNDTFNNYKPTNFQLNPRPRVHVTVRPTKNRSIISNSSSQNNLDDLSFTNNNNNMSNNQTKSTIIINTNNKSTNIIDTNTNLVNNQADTTNLNPHANNTWNTNRNENDVNIMNKTNIALINSTNNDMTTNKDNNINLNNKMEAKSIDFIDPASKNQENSNSHYSSSISSRDDILGTQNLDYGCSTSNITTIQPDINDSTHQNTDETKNEVDETIHSNDICSRIDANITDYQNDTDNHIMSTKSLIENSNDIDDMKPDQFTLKSLDDISTHFDAYRVHSLSQNNDDQVNLILVENNDNIFEHQLELSSSVRSNTLENTEVADGDIVTSPHFVLTYDNPVTNDYPSTQILYDENGTINVVENDENYVNNNGNNPNFDGIDENDIKSDENSFNQFDNTVEFRSGFDNSTNFRAYDNTVQFINEDESSLLEDLNNSVGRTISLDDLLKMSTLVSNDENNTTCLIISSPILSGNTLDCNVGEQSNSTIERKIFPDDLSTDNIRTDGKEGSVSSSIDNTNMSSIGIGFSDSGRSSNVSGPDITTNSTLSTQLLDCTTPKNGNNSNSQEYTKRARQKGSVYRSISTPHNMLNRGNYNYEHPNRPVGDNHSKLGISQPKLNTNQELNITNMKTLDQLRNQEDNEPRNTEVSDSKKKGVCQPTTQTPLKVEFTPFAQRLEESKQKLQEEIDKSYQDIQITNDKVEDEAIEDETPFPDDSEESDVYDSDGFIKEVKIPLESSQVHGFSLPTIGDQLFDFKPCIKTDEGWIRPE